MWFPKDIFPLLLPTVFSPTLPNTTISVSVAIEQDQQQNYHYNWSTGIALVRTQNTDD